jgi:hypothetical protein
MEIVMAGEAEVSLVFSVLGTDLFKSQNNKVVASMQDVKRSYDQLKSQIGQTRQIMALGALAYNVATTGSVGEFIKGAATQAVSLGVILGASEIGSDAGVKLATKRAAKLTEEAGDKLKATFGKLGAVVGGIVGSIAISFVGAIIEQRYNEIQARRIRNEEALRVSSDALAMGPNVRRRVLDVDEPERLRAEIQRQYMEMGGRQAIGQFFPGSNEDVRDDRLKQMERELIEMRNRFEEVDRQNARRFESISFGTRL